MNKWTCPTGEQWERFLLATQMSQRKALEEHLETCPYCRFLIAERRRELRELEAVWENSVGPQVIQLTPLEIADQRGEPATTLLAAQGGGDPMRQEAITLASPDQTLLLRAVRDLRSRELWLYLMADDPSTCRNVLVTPFGGEKEFLTDEQGRVNLGVVDWPKPLALTVDVSLPKAVFTLAPMKDQLGEGEAFELSSAAGDRIKVTFRGGGAGRHLEVQIVAFADIKEMMPIKVAIRGTGMVKIFQVDPAAFGKVPFEEQDKPGTLDIYLYQ